VEEHERIIIKGDVRGGLHWFRSTVFLWPCAVRRSRLFHRWRSRPVSSFRLIESANGPAGRVPLGSILKLPAGWKLFIPKGVIAQ
jgi:hypothetical protein